MDINKINSETDDILSELFQNGDIKLRKLDHWVEKKIFENCNIRYHSSRPYSYAKYDKIIELVKIYGTDIVEKLFQECSYIKKDLEGKHELIDSIAWVIWDKRLDPYSIMPTIPKFSSMWDKISEDGYGNKS